jgi:uncharacterized protein DUF4259
MTTLWIGSAISAPKGIQAAAPALADVLALKGEYLEAPLASRAVAAAEVVAAASGRPGANLPDDLTEWPASHQVPQCAELLRNASAALTRVMAESELRDLWADSEEFKAWKATLQDVLSRLG